MKEYPSYYGTLPANVRYANIPPMAKILYAELTALVQERGYCFANNNYFAKLYDLSTGQISRLLNSLKNNEFIEVKISKKQGNKRKIILAEDYAQKSPDLYAKKPIPIRKKRKHNNITLTLDNNISNNSNKSLASINNTSKDNSRYIGDTKKQQKQQYGKFSNVLLTEDDYKKLEDEVDDIDKWIKLLDRGIEQKGYTYRSHYATILDWYEQDCEKENKESDESDKYLKTTSRLKKDVKFKKAVEESKKSIAKMLRGKNK